MIKYFFAFPIYLSSFLAGGQETPNKILSQWQIANPYGILNGSPKSCYEAGRVNDILEVDHQTILAAADNGGIWMLRRGGNVAVSFSRNWEAPDMVSLAKYNIPATRRMVYYAGGYNNLATEGALYQTNPASTVPLLENWEPIPLSGVGTIKKILVMQGFQKIIIATSNGIWWSAIPPSGLAADYKFIPAETSAIGDLPFFDLTESPMNKVVASRQGGGHPLYYGTFANETFTFSRSALNGLSDVDTSLVGTTSVSSCQSAKEYVYAITARKSDGLPLAIFKSIDGGITFNRINIYLPDNPTPQFGISGMFRTNCIDVHPSNPQMIVFGWVTGPYISNNGGESFVEVSRDLTHDDKACLLFSSLNAHRLYLGSDGGVVSFNSFNPAKNYNLDYSWNKRLATLQFEGPTAIRGWWGRMDVVNSPDIRIGGGLQDNGVVHCINNSPWKHIESGYDGGTVFYPACGGILWANAGGGLRYRSGKPERDDVIPIKVFAPGADQRINTLNGLFEKVNGTSRKRNADGQSMYAISTNTADMIEGSGNMNTLYGIFANVDGTDMHAEYLATLEGTQCFTSALSSNDANEILVGKRTTAGIYRLAWNDMEGNYHQVQGNIPERNHFFAALSGIVDVPGSAECFAFRNDEYGNAFVYYSPDGSDWRIISSLLPREKIYSIALFKNTCKEILFAGTDNAIYATLDKGISWTNVSFGLPYVPHCSDIQVIPSSNCTTEIFLSTFGWSVWKATIQ